MNCGRWPEKKGDGAVRVFGIDPGYAIVGCGVVDCAKGKYRMVEYGAITTPAGMEMGQRLATIYDQLTFALEKYRPEAVAIEQLFATHNQTTVMGVAQARGVILLACQQKGLPVYEYTPMQVKMAVVGYGNAEKRQVMEMTKNLLGLTEIPKPDDAADALAIAICHGNVGGSVLFQKKLQMR